MTDVHPILTQPHTVPGAPPSSANARIRAYIPTEEHVYPTPNSYLVRLTSWTSEESEAQVAISPASVSVVGPMSSIRQRDGSLRYDDWNNPTFVYGHTVGGVTSLQTASYINHAFTWVIGLPDLTKEWMWDADENAPLPRTVDRDYDNLGRLILVTREPNDAGSLWQQLELLRDADGQVEKVTRRVLTGQANRVDHLYYDIERIFVEQANNGEGHWTSQVFQPALGVVGVTEDANGVKTTFAYDGFGRFRGASPDGGMAAGASYAAYQPTAGVNAGLEVTHTAVDGSAVIERIDELGRRFELRRLAFDGTTWAVQDAGFNVFGTTTSESRPGDGSPSAHGVVYTYDSLGRLEKRLDPAGTFTTVGYVVSSQGTVSTSTDPR